jgi:hypothetical protein
VAQLVAGQQLPVVVAQLERLEYLVPPAAERRVAKEQGSAR